MNWRCEETVVWTVLCVVKQAAWGTQEVRAIDSVGRVVRVESEVKLWKW